MYNELIELIERVSNMQLTGQNVNHTAFGEGVIKGQKGNIITVEFPQGEKRFLYPDVFEQYLTMSDPAAAQKIETLLHSREEQKNEELQAILEEQERVQRLQNFKISATSQAAFSLDLEPLDADWSIHTGAYLSGCSKGEPRVPEKLKPNSACLLTEKGETEEERRIVGLFMVPEDYFGDEHPEGIVFAHPEYRIRLTGAQTLSFWDYFRDAKRKPRWGSTAFKYFSNKVMQHILFDLQDVLKDTDQEELAKDFYSYYNRLNRMANYHSYR